MPNWNLNTITITARTPEQIQRLKDAVASNKFMSSFYPAPQELLEFDAPQQDPALKAQLMEKYGAEDWYQWANNNWGVKWDFQLESVDVRESDGVYTVTGTADTAWAPPITFLERLVEEGYSVVDMYWEPGMAFCGIWDNGCDEYYDYSCSADLEDIPEVLNECYDLYNSVAMWEEDAEQV